MKIHLVYSDKSLKDLAELPTQVSRRIFDKMDWFLAQDHPLRFAERLQGTMGTFCRFRVGDYRVICEEQHGAIRILMVITVRNRKDAY